MPCYERIVVQLQLCLEMNDTPDRLKKKLKANLQFGIAENIQKVLVNSTEKCNTELTYGGEKLGTVKLQRDSKEIVSHHFYLRLHMNVVTFGEGKAGHQF